MNRSEKPIDQSPENLAALEAVLAGKRVSEEHKDLEQLINQLQSERPKPKEGLATQLYDHTVTQPKHRQWVGVLFSRQARIPAVASLAVAIVVAGVLVTGDSPTNNKRVAQNPVRQEDRLVGKRTASSSGIQSPAPSGGSRSGKIGKEAAVPLVETTGGRKPDADQLRGDDRKVERNASVTLQTTNSEVEDVAQSVLKVVDRYQGIVMNSSLVLSQATGGNEAIFQLRIPNERFSAALAALSDLATVKERTDQTQDVTKSYLSTSDLLSQARAERRGLLRSLARAKSRSEIENVRAQLRLNQSTVAQYDRQLRELKQRVNLTNLQLTVEGGGKTKAQEDAAWTPSEAWNSLKGLLVTIGTIILVGLGILIPCALVLTFVISLVKLRRRRLRRQVLEGNG